MSVTVSVRKSIFKTTTTMGKSGASVTFGHLGNVGLSRKLSSLKKYTITPSRPSYRLEDAGIQQGQILPQHLYQ
jgi:hypothetical protein